MFLKNLMQKRLENSGKYKKVNIFFIFFTPLCLLLMTEYNQMQSVSNLAKFIFGSFTIFLFDLILVSLIFCGVLFLVKKLYATVLFLGLTLFSLSCGEYFKYLSTGTHLLISDLTLITTPGELVHFAKLDIPATMLMVLALLIVYCGIIYWFNPVISFTLKKSLPIGAISFALSLVMVITPVSTLFYRSFNINHSQTSNAFITNEKFQDNELIAFLATNMSQQIDSFMRAPDNYNEKSVNALLKPGKAAVQTKKPNIVVIMSESFADLRRYGSDMSFSGLYDAYDKAADKSYQGTAIVPTFGGYTVRTEFELLFGLPVKSTGNSIYPHNLLKNRQQLTMPRYFAENGYNTVFIHPFNSAIYNRGKIYTEYGFNSLKFQDDLDVENKQFHDYTDDGTIYEQILFELQESDTPGYIFTTTIQNHLPYEEEGVSEFDYYLEGIHHSSEMLEEFICKLEAFEEDTIVLFIGDHLPYLSGEDNFYTKAGINNANSYKFYEQSYLIYNNFGLDISVSADKVSAFYLPHIIIDSLGFEQTPFISTMLDKMQEKPVYSINQTENDNLLDTLTYDRVKGKLFSGQQEKQPDSSWLNH